MQHLGEICMAQRSRGKDKQGKRQTKARKEIQKRSFWRRFFSSFLSLLKEKRPPEAKEDGLLERGISFDNPSVALRATPQLRFAAQPSVHPKGTCFAASTGPPLHKGGFGMYSTTEKRY